MEKAELIHNLEISLDAIYQISSKEEDLEKAKSAIETFAKRAQSMGQSYVFWPTLIIWIIFLEINSRLAPWISEALAYLDIQTAGAVDTFIAQTLTVISVVLAILVWGKLLKRKRRCAEEAKVYRAEQGPVVLEEYEAQKTSMENLIQSEMVQIMQQTIPADYASVDAVSFFLLALNNQRANVLKEVINLYESEKHNRELLDMQQKELELLLKTVELGEAQLAVQQKSLKTQEKSLHTQGALLDKTKKMSKQVRFSNAVGIINTVKHWKN